MCAKPLSTSSTPSSEQATSAPHGADVLPIQEGLERLKQSGSKLTSQRLAMLDLFSQAPIHMTAQQVLNELTSDEPTLSRATVYNNLELFESLHIIVKHQSSDGTIYYDSNTSSHHHMSCMQCGAIQDVHVPADLLAQLTSRSALLHSPESPQSNPLSDVVSIWFKGVCEHCK